MSSDQTQVKQQDTVILALRRKFVRTAMLALFPVLAALVLVINLVNQIQATRTADETLARLTSDGGLGGPMALPPQGPEGAPETGGAPPARPERPEGFGPDRTVGWLPWSDHDILRYGREAELPFNTRFFLVRFPADDPAQVSVDVSHIAALTAEEALVYGTRARDRLAQGQARGNLGIYRYLATEQEEETVIAFLDRSETLYNARRLLFSSCAVGALTLLAVFVMTRLFAGRAVLPVAESLEKQKRFITDAGHELKTPLAVMSADLDVLEIEQGKSEWTESIRGQIRRMTGLVGNFLTLARMEEGMAQKAAAPVDLSSVLARVTESFSPVAERRRIRTTRQIEEGVTVLAEPDAAERLCTILIDNAYQYCTEEGSVRIRLREEDGKAVLTVQNPCDTMPEGNLDRLFDRFYRADTSRSRKTGGYGIGLSAAAAIAKSCGGTIRAGREGTEEIVFVVTLPATGKPAEK